MASIINASTTGGGGVITTADASGVLQLQTGGTTAVTVDASQNVGIGTASPITKLNVYGNTTTNTALVVSNASGNIGVFGNEATWLGAGSSNNLAISSFGSNSLLLGTAGTERMRIDSSGNLLVGCTSAPSVSVNGCEIASASIQISSPSATANFVLYKPASAAQTAFIYFNTNSSFIGSIVQNGNSAVSYVTSSDYRLKKDIAPMVGALDTVAALKPVTYKWKLDDSDGQGFIAHELQAVVPDCVTGEKDAVDADGNPQYQGIDTSFLVATLTAAIQELKAIVDTQAEQIKALQGAQ